MPETFADTAPVAAGTASARRRGIVTPRLALLLVATAHGLLPLVLLGAHHFYGHDEVVYLSQYSAHSPAAYFSAPRSRGTALLVAPVTATTSSLVVLRVYLAALSAVGTYLAFVPWFAALAAARRAVSPYVVPVAAALLSTLWVSIYYSFEAMPNQWAMFGIVAAVGLVLSAARRPNRRTEVGIVVALAMTGLFRPQDSLWPGVALLLCIACFRDRSRAQRLRLGVVVAIGLVVGWLDWIVEAYLYFHGPAYRIHQSLVVNGGSGAHFSLNEQWSVLSGPLLCRRGCHATPAIIDQLWWVAGAVLVIGALVLARRLGGMRVAAVSTVCGLAAIAEYAVSVTYGAPRFMLPAYGLLSVPVAMALVWAVRRLRRPLIPLLVAGCVAQLALQADVLLVTINGPIQRHAQQVIALDTSLQRAGLGQPGCVTYWDRHGTVSDYVLGCRNHQLRETTPPPTTTLPGQPPVWVLASHRPLTAAWFNGWARDTIAVGGGHIYLWSNGTPPPAIAFAYPVLRSAGNVRTTPPTPTSRGNGAAVTAGEREPGARYSERRIKRPIPWPMSGTRRANRGREADIGGP